MRNLPADMLALAQKTPPPEEWIIACLKMPSGNVWLSDRPVSATLLALLPVRANPLPIVEDWGTLDDGQGIDKILAAGTIGYLCAPKTRIVLIRADQTKSQVDSIISQGIHNRRIELYRWFSGMTSSPVLIDTLFCQDRIELSESSMLFSFDAVGALTSENPYMTDRTNGQKNYPYLIGKAEGVPLELLEEESSKWTVLLGDQDGEDIDKEYTGLIRVSNANRLDAGQHLINGEEVILAKASAGYMKITARASSGTEAQEHSNGSRIFPLGAVFKYAACAGPIGSFEKLRTSNEIDLYDEDGDGNTVEYRDLYSGENEEYHPELNPAQIWFYDRMPWLKKNQELELEKEFRGLSASFSSALYCRYATDINKKDGKAEIRIPYTALTGGATGQLEGIEAAAYAPGMPGDDPTYTDMGFEGGDFEVTQHYGDPSSGDNYREFRIKSSAAPGESAATLVAMNPPEEGKEYYKYEQILFAIPTVSGWTSYMDMRIELIRKTPLGEAVLWSHTTLGKLSGPMEDMTLRQQVWYANMLNIPDDTERIMFRLTCLGVGSEPDPYAYIRIGGQTVGSEGNTTYNTVIAFWAYRNNQPAAWIESQFGRNLSARGDFLSAEVMIKGVIRNSNNKAIGALKVYDGLIEKHSEAIPNDGGEVEVSFSLDAVNWIELVFSKVKVELQLEGLDGTIDNGSVNFEFTKGVQWNIRYVSDNLDGVQVNYTDTLYVDAVSSRDADWTPAEAFKWLSEDKTSWAADMLDLSAIDARRAEYDAAGHYLNGLLSSERYQGAIKEIARQGFFLPFQDNGKISLQSYLSWPGTVSLSGGNDSLLEKSKTFEMTDTNSVVQKLVVDYNKNFSTGFFDGQYELNTGTHVEQMNSISLDLVKSESAVILLATWLFNIKYIQLKCLGFDGNFRLIEPQIWDKIELPDFLASDLQAELIVTGVQQQFAQPKNDRPSKFIIKTIRV